MFHSSFVSEPCPLLTLWIRAISYRSMTLTALCWGPSSLVVVVVLYIVPLATPCLCAGVVTEDTIVVAFLRTECLELIRTTTTVGYMPCT